MLRRAEPVGEAGAERGRRTRVEGRPGRDRPCELRHGPFRSFIASEAKRPSFILALGCFVALRLEMTAGEAQACTTITLSLAPQLSGTLRSSSSSHTRALPSDGGAPVAARRQRSAGRHLGSVGHGGPLELAEAEKALHEDLQPSPDMAEVVGAATLDRGSLRATRPKPHRPTPSGPGTRSSTDETHGAACRTG